MLRSVIFVLCLAVIGMPWGAKGAVLRVPSEYATINQAMGAAQPGDTVLVAPGTYTDFETRIGPTGAPVSSCAFVEGSVALVSESGPAATTIRLDQFVGFPRVVYANEIADPIEIRGFTITSSVSDLGVAGINLLFSNTATVEDCVIRDLGVGLGGTAGLVGPGQDLVVRNCQFRDIQGEVGSALKVGDARILVEDCRFESCGSEGAVSLSGQIGSTSDVTFRSTQFVGNVGGALGLGGYASVTVQGCWFADNDNTESAGGAIDVATRGQSILIEGNGFVRNHTTGLGGAIRIQDTGGGSIAIRENTIHACSQFFSGGGSAIFVVSGVVDVSANVMSASVGAAAVGVSSWPPPGGQVQSDCNVFWENEEGDVDGVTLGPNDQVADPLYCDPAADNHTVASNSPCLPQNSGPCGQIGAYGEGCAAVSVEPTSWGEIKGRFRD